MPLDYIKLAIEWATMALYFLYIPLAIIVLIVVGLKKKRWKPVFITAVLLVVIPLYDVIIVGTFYLGHSLHGPFQEIRRVVDQPESVYWEDNVWPGFDEYGRDWMVNSYLDGKNLKMLALNGDDGKIYLYRFETKDKPEVFDTVRQLPPMRYGVAFNPVPLFFFEKWFVHGDEMRIVDFSKKETMAFSRRYLAYNMTIWSRGLNSSPFETNFRLGDERVYEFDDKVLFRYAGVRGNFEYIKDTFQRSRYNMLVINNKDRFKK